MTVSELAGASGVAAGTVRNWDRTGLLPAPPRSANGYRRYDPATSERIRFIRGAQRAGLRLREVRQLLEIRDRCACPCGHTRRLVAARIDELDTELDRLRALRR